VNKGLGWDFSLPGAVGQITSFPHVLFAPYDTEKGDTSVGSDSITQRSPSPARDKQAQLETSCSHLKPRLCPAQEGSREEEIRLSESPSPKSPRQIQPGAGGARGHTAGGVGWSSRLRAGSGETKSPRDGVTAPRRAISARR